MAKDELQQAYAALEKLARVVRTSIEQWGRLPELVKAGRLVKEAKGYYRLIDPKASNEVGELIQELEFGDDGKLVRLKLEKPDPKLLEDIEALLPKRH